MTYAFYLLPTKNSKASFELELINVGSFELATDIHTSSKKYFPEIYKCIESEILKPFDLRKFVINGRKSTEILKKLAASSSLYWNKSKLAIDPFTEVVLEYSLKEEKGFYELSANLLTRSSITPVKQINAFFKGEKSFFIEGALLRFLHEDLEWKWVEKVIFQNKVLSEQEWLGLFHEIKAELKEGVFHLKKELSSSYDATKKPPEPLLQLVDQAGTAAHLFMQYEGIGLINIQDGKGSSFRQAEFEKQCEKDLIESGFTKKYTLGSNYFCARHQVSAILTFLLELGWKVQHVNNKPFKLMPKQEIVMRQEGDHVRLHALMKAGDEELTLSDIMQVAKQQQHFIERDTAYFVIETPQLIEGLKGAPYQISEKGDLLIPKEFAGLLDKESHDEEPTDNVVAFFEKQHEFKHVDLLVPIKLFPFQERGARWLYTLYQQKLNGLLADDMGLGKTIQVLAFLSLISESGPIVIVVPTSLMTNWKMEVMKILHKMPYIHHGNHRHKKLEDLLQERIIITSYMTLVKDVELFKEIPIEVLVIDEAQMIKNHKTIVFECLIRMKTRMKISLSGTPLENKIDELWSQFHFLLPSLLGSLKEFKQSIQDARQKKLIKKLLSPFIMRRMKHQVEIEFPPKIEQLIYLEMDEEERAFYNKYHEQVKSHLLKDQKKNRASVFEGILRLRQLCCDASLVEEGTNFSKSKLTKVIEDIVQIEESGHKVLIFSQFTSMLQRIQEELKSFGLSSLYLDGATKDRQKVVDSFNEHAQHKILLMSLKAGGVGLNLTAADYVLIYEPWWNDAAENQAIMRAHRLGRQGKVIAKRYILLSTIEEKILRLKEAKMKIAADFLESQEADDGITMEELYELLD